MSGRRPQREAARPSAAGDAPVHLQPIPDTFTLCWGNSSPAADAQNTQLLIFGICPADALPRTHAGFPHTPLVRSVPTGKRSCCSFCARLQTGLEEMPKRKTTAPRSDLSSPGTLLNARGAHGSKWSTAPLIAAQASRMALRLLLLF